MRASLFFPVVFFFLGLSLLACKPNKENPASSEVVATGDPVLDQLSQAIAARPKELSLYYERATRYYALENYDEAITDLQQALRFDSANVECLHLLADVYLDYFRSREAIKTMEKTISFYPERIPSLLKLCEFQLILKQHEASLKTIDRVLQLDPQNAEGYFMMGMNFKESGDTARAVNAFQTAVENDPELLDAWINLGQLQAALGNKIAARYFDSALRIAPNSATALHAKAYYLQEQGKLSEALALFRKMGSLDPQNAEAHYNAGLLCLDLDSIPQAWRAFDLAVRMDPVHVRAYFYRGLASEIQGNAAQARSDYQQALKLAPDYEKPRQGLERLDKDPK